MDVVAPIGPGGRFHGAPVVRTPGLPFVAGSSDWLTVREAAVRLKVSRATIYALVERGELPHVRVGNQIRISGRPKHEPPGL